MKKIRVGIDVDNVIADFEDLFVKEFNRVTKQNLDKKQLLKWNYKEAIRDIYNTNIYDELVNEIISTPNFVLNLKFIGNAKEVLRDLYYSENIEPVIITSLIDKMIPYRNKWFENNFKDCKFEIHYKTDKRGIEVDYFIDDGIHNLDAVSTVIGTDNCLCIETIYNKNSKYKTFDSLENAINYIKYKESQNLYKCI